MTESVYLDANALIEAVESEDMAGLGFIRSKRDVGTCIVTSELTFAEVSMRPIQDRNAPLVELYEDLIFGGKLVDAMPIGREVLWKSAEVRAWLGGRLPDTIHVATAILARCDLIVSSDLRLRMPHGLTRLSLRELMQMDAPS